MQALMSRPGYSATRYQGTKITFDAQTRTLELEGRRAGVSRDQTVLVADSITYNDSTRMVFARAAPGDTIVLRDPTQNAADVIALRGMTYNVAARRGTVTEISTSIAETGQNWFIRGRQAAFVSDTTRGRETAFYARNGSITSCDDSIPDYHFEAKEIKMVSKNIMVARPAVLYIGDVPIMWLPFIFQDMRSGRRSGVLRPGPPSLTRTWAPSGLIATRPELTARRCELFGRSKASSSPLCPSGLARPTIRRSPAQPMTP